ncbi:MAG: hypothetical protein K0U39_07135 [Alphaproteobacteria bacterium]|nr:hypothetical protein [Alphaproteobacteria bacterium]
MSDLLKLKGNSDSDNPENKKQSDQYESSVEDNKQKYENYFISVFVGVILLDSCLFLFIVDGLAALSLTILQVLLLLVLGSKLNINSVDIIFKRITGMLGKNGEE